MFRQSARKLTKTKITAVSNTHALIVMVSLAFNAVTNMEPRDVYKRQLKIRAVGIVAAQTFVLIPGKFVIFR